VDEAACKWFQALREVNAKRALTLSAQAVRYLVPQSRLLGGCGSR
jgi:hypothetical protein